MSDPTSITTAFLSNETAGALEDLAFQIIGTDDIQTRSKLADDLADAVLEATGWHTRDKAQRSAENAG